METRELSGVFGSDVLIRRRNGKQKNFDFKIYFPDETIQLVRINDCRVDGEIFTNRQMIMILGTIFNNDNLSMTLTIEKVADGELWKIDMPGELTITLLGDKTISSICL